MRPLIRRITDKSFTYLAGSSVVLLTAVLLIVLGPMVWRGAKAVIFKDTIEFRKMQLDLYNRGNPENLNTEVAEAKNFRAIVYDTINKFKHGIDTEELTDRAKQIYRQNHHSRLILTCTAQTQIRTVTIRPQIKPFCLMSPKGQYSSKKPILEKKCLQSEGHHV